MVANASGHPSPHPCSPATPAAQPTPRHAYTPPPPTDRQARPRSSLSHGCRNVQPDKGAVKASASAPATRGPARQRARGENWAGCAEELLTSADRTVRLNAVAAASWNDGTPAPHY